MIPEVCKELDIAYDTAKVHLLHLAAKDQIEMRKIGRHWIFWKKK
jgi:predicted transcriptional regulator